MIIFIKKPGSFSPSTKTSFHFLLRREVSERFVIRSHNERQVKKDKTKVKNESEERKFEVDSGTLRYVTVM
eukprot:747399-Hanusia_phi.AAC.1